MVYSTVLYKIEQYHFRWVSESLVLARLSDAHIGWATSVETHN